MQATDRWRLPLFALLHWSLSRIIFFAAAVLAHSVFLPTMTNDEIAVPGWSDIADTVIEASARAEDAGWYGNLATNGYDLGPPQYETEKNWALFPLVTVMWHLFPDLGTREIAAQAISALGFVLFAMLAVSLFGAEVGRTSLLLAAYFPFSYFISVNRPETLLFVLLVAIYMLVRKGQYLLAGLLGALAALAKPDGFLAFLLFTGPLFAYRDNLRGLLRRPDLVIGALLPIIALAGFSSYMWMHVGDPLAWAKIQQAWGAQPPGYLPLQQLETLFTAPMLIGRWGWDPTLLNWLVIVLVVVALGGLVIARQWDLALFLLAVSLASFVTFGVWVQGKHMAATFAFFLGLGLVVKTEARSIPLLVLFAGALAVSGALAAMEVHAAFG